MTNPNIHYLQVPCEQAGLRLDKYLAVSLPDISRSQVKRLIEGGSVCKSDKVVYDCSMLVKEGDNYVVTVPPPEDTDITPASIPLNILYEDGDLLVIDKQAGLTVHPGAGNHNDTLANALVAHCGDSLSGIGGVMRPGIVHRLDKDTSGVMLAAKTDLAHQSLSKQISERSAKRTYLALCWGVPRPMHGRIEANIGRSPKNRKKMTVLKTGGKTAVTNYKVLKILANSKASLIECRLETGRTHQIRVHMAHIGCPVIGDQVYCGRRAGSMKELNVAAKDKIQVLARQALHSHVIEFAHPASGKEMRFSSALPLQLQEILTALDIL